MGSNPKGCGKALCGSPPLLSSVVGEEEGEEWSEGGGGREKCRGIK